MSRVVVVLLLLASVSLASNADVEKAPVGWVGVLLDQGGPTGDPPRPTVRVGGVVESSPAERAGLRASDRILELDGTAVSSPGDLISRVRSYEPESWVTLKLERAGQERDIQLKLGTRPQRTNRLSIRRGWIGVEAIDLPETLQEHFGAPEGSGVMVSDVAPGSPAEAAGFELGDVVYAIGERPVRSARDLNAGVATGGIGNVLEFSAMRHGAEITLESMVEKALQK